MHYKHIFHIPMIWIKNEIHIPKVLNFRHVFMFLSILICILYILFIYVLKAYYSFTYIVYKKNKMYNTLYFT